MPKKKSKEKNMTDQFKQLEQIVANFEHGEIELEESIKKFKTGLKIAQSLKKKLKNMENEIEKIKLDYE